MVSKTTVVIKGVFMLFVVWLTWYAVIGVLIGPLDNVFYPLASKYPQFMEWYPFMSAAVNYAPVIATFAIILWMIYRGNESTREEETYPTGWF